MANRAAPPPPPPNGSMMTMLLVMILMTFLIINPNIRNALGNMADPILAPVLPETKYFVLTVPNSWNIFDDFEYGTPKFLRRPNRASSYWTSPIAGSKDDE
jgi:hypothetical protein